MQLLCPICQHTLPVRMAEPKSRPMVVDLMAILFTIRCRRCTNVVGFTGKMLGYRQLAADNLSPRS